VSVVITPEIQTRSFLEPIATPGITWDVTRFGWAAIGGPAQAEVVGRGSLAALASQFDRLRCPVILRSGRGVPVWWGYVHEVALRYGSITLGATLDSLSNWVTVFYSEEGAGTDSLPTAPAFNERSIALFGIKELRENLSQANAALADARRDLLLGQQAYPMGTIAFDSGDEAAAEIRFVCKGWWETLWWRYWATTATGQVSLTQQIVDCVSTVGQFFVGTRIDQTSSLTSEPTQDGNTKAGDVILELLKQGVGGGLRSLATVTQERYLRIVPEPAQPADDDYLLVTREGRVHTPMNQPLPPHIPPVGRWGRVRDIPATLNLGAVQDPTRFFLEAAEFDTAAGSWTLTTRGKADVFAELFSIGM